MQIYKSLVLFGAILFSMSCGRSSAEEGRIYQTFARIYMCRGYQVQAQTEYDTMWYHSCVAGAIAAEPKVTRKDLMDFWEEKKQEKKLDVFFDSISERIRLM